MYLCSKLKGVNLLESYLYYSLQFYGSLFCQANICPLQARGSGRHVCFLIRGLLMSWLPNLKSNKLLQAVSNILLQ